MSDKQSVHHARSNPQFRKRMLDLYGATTLIGYARASKPWIPDANHVPLAYQFVRAMDTFVLAHEVSHGVLGHLEEAQQVPIGHGSLSDANALIMSHDQEYEADVSGLYISLAVAQQEGTSASVAVLSAYAFMKAIELLEKCFDLFDQSVSDLLSTHPKASDRAAHILAAAKSIPPTREGQSRIMMQARRIDHIFYWTGQDVLRALKVMKAMGMKPRRKEMQSVLELDKPSILGILPVAAKPMSPLVGSFRQAASEGASGI